MMAPRILLQYNEDKKKKKKISETLDGRKSHIARSHVTPCTLPIRRVDWRG